MRKVVMKEEAQSKVRVEAEEMNKVEKEAKN